MNKSIFLSFVFLLGCNAKVVQEKYFVKETDEFYIPDSNKQKYADFVSKSVSGCQEDCRWFLDDVKEEAGKIYGTRIAELRIRSSKYSSGCGGEGCFDSVISKDEMTPDELLLVKEYVVK